MKGSTITIIFDDEKDCEAVMEAISKKLEMTWNYGTRKAMIAGDKKKFTVRVSKSVPDIPAPIRL